MVYLCRRKIDPAKYRFDKMEMETENETETEEQTIKTLPQLPDHVWYYIIGYLGFQQRLSLDMLLIVTTEPRLPVSVFNAVGGLWTTNIYVEACRPKVPAAIQWLAPEELFRDILWNIRPTEDNVTGMWTTCIKTLRPQTISRIMAHDIMCVMCIVPWFREEYAEQLCQALSGCHRNATDSSWPKGHVAKRTGLQYGFYMEYNMDTNMYVRRRRAPFDMDDEGTRVPDFALYSSSVEPGWVDTPIITYHETGEISLDIWLSIGSVFVAACESCNLRAAKWLVAKFPDYFYNYDTATCALIGASQRCEPSYSKVTPTPDPAKYAELSMWINELLNN